MGLDFYISGFMDFNFLNFNHSLFVQESHNRRGYHRGDNCFQLSLAVRRKALAL